ncbi:MAG: hypothetical protein JNL98_34080 [Bryobacterales bacterium]|nr:hypothetical protein [Bryobacterales bacterium]
MSRHQAGNSGSILAAADMHLPENIDFDGINLLPSLTGRNRPAPHETPFWRCGNVRVVRKGQWKLIEFGPDPSEMTGLSTVEFRL